MNTEPVFEILDKLYFATDHHYSKDSRKYNDKFYPLIYLDKYEDIEIEVSIDSVERDVRLEDGDEYFHAMRMCALPLSFYSDYKLSSLFDHGLFTYLFEKKMFFKELKKYVAKNRNYVYCQGELKMFLSIGTVCDSEFSYSSHLARLYANRDMKDTYLIFEDKAIISEEEFHKLNNEIDIYMKKLENIYHQYYQEFFIPLYELSDELLLHPDDVELKEKVNQEYQRIIDKEMINDYIRRKIVDEEK